MNAHQRLASRWGAQLRPAGGCAFGLWAPGQERVILEIDGMPPLAMQPEPGGWFHAEAVCCAQLHYRYRLASGAVIADPASRWQPRGVDGPSAVVDHQAYRWQHEAWRGRPWHEAVIYELHVGACGGYAGVHALLPQLAALGISALELMPLAEFAGSRNWGYDGALPYAPESSYGRPEALKQLIDSAHGLGLMVYLDVVYNHFGPEGNVLHACAPSFFRDDLQTPWGAAIDFRRPEVREFFIGNALHWLLDYRFDGLRLDAVHAIEDPDFLDVLAAAVRAAVGPDRHVHLVVENEHNDARLLRDGAYQAQWNDDFHNSLHVLLTGEHEGYYADYSSAPAAQLARCLAEGFAWQGESPPSRGAARGSPSADLPPQAFVHFLQNHDQVGNRALGERLTQLVAPAALEAAMALLLLGPAIPLLFMGEEFASTAPFLFFTDFGAELAAAVREGRRREFAGFASFAAPEARAAIPDPNAKDSFHRSCPELSAASASARQRVALVRRLLRLRRELLLPRLPGTRSLGAQVLAVRALAAAWRLGDGARWQIALNLGTEPLAAPAGRGRLVHESPHGSARALQAGQLPPQAVCVYLEEAP